MMSENNEIIETRKVSIKEIIGKTDFTMREGLDKKLVAQYKENLSIIIDENPIKIYDTPSGLHLYDGFHRLASARQLNWTKIKAIVKKGSVQDAYAAACLANLKHGKPLTINEKKKAICEFIKLRVEWSDRRIAVEVGVSKDTIGRRRKELEFRREIEPQDKRVSKDGQIQPADKGVSIETPSEEELLEERFQEWFSEHVVCSDAFKVMSALERKFDLAIVDPPYGITTEDWDLTNKHELLVFTRRWLRARKLG